MKKVLALALVFVMTALCLTGCGKTDATKNVIEMIKGIGEVTDESGDYLSEIEAAYKKLTEKEQKKVGNYSKYEKALEEYNEIYEFNFNVLTIKDAAMTTFSKENYSFEELITLGRELLDKYDAMSDKRKESVVDEISELEAAIGIIETYRKNAVACAASYCKAFLEVYKANNYEITDIGCICQIRNDTQYMFFALAAKNSSKEAKYYSQARFAEPNVYKAMINNPEIFFADKPVDDDSDALENRNFTLSVEEVMAEVNAGAEETTAAAAEETTAETAEETAAEELPAETSAETTEA